MNSRELFRKVCAFEPLTRPPVDYLSTRGADEGLMKYFGVSSEKELLDCLQSDFFYLPSRDISQNEGYLRCYKKQTLIEESRRVCPLGIGWTRGAHTHKFMVDSALDNPLKHAESVQDILAHPLPTRADFDFSALAPEYEANRDRIIVGGLWTGIMGDSYRLMGFENFLLYCALDFDMIKTLVGRLTDMYLDLNDAYFTAMKGKMDIWFFGNDFGSQNGLIVSPDMWHELFFENIKKLTTLAHSHGLKVMMHSCGAISDIIGSLISAGVDILDPIQVTAGGMEPSGLADKFGGKMIFHGGIDTQNTLITGTVAQVKEHAAATIKALSSKNGYIFAPTQIYGPDIPSENIAAAYEVVNSLK